MPPSMRPRPTQKRDDKYEKLLNKAVGPPTPTIEDLLGEDADGNDGDALFAPPRSVRSGATESGRSPNQILRRNSKVIKTADKPRSLPPATYKKTRNLNNVITAGLPSRTTRTTNIPQSPKNISVLPTVDRTLRSPIFFTDVGAVSVVGTADEVNTSTDEATPLLFEFLEFVQQKLSEYVPESHDQLLAVHHVNYLVMTAVGFCHNDITSITDALKFNADPFNGIFTRQAPLVAIQRFFHRVIIDLHDFIPRIEAARLATNNTARRSEPIPAELFDKLARINEAYGKVFHIYRPFTSTIEGRQHQLQRRSFFYETMTATTGIMADMYHLHDRLLCLHFDDSNWDAEMLPKSSNELRSVYSEFKAHLARERYNALHHIGLIAATAQSFKEAPATQAPADEMEEHCMTIIDGLMMNASELNSVHTLIYSIHPAIRDWLCLMQAGTSEETVKRISALQCACDRISKRVLLYVHHFCSHRKPLIEDSSSSSDGDEADEVHSKEAESSQVDRSQSSTSSSSSDGNKTRDNESSSSSSSSDEETESDRGNNQSRKQPYKKRRRCFHARFNHIIHLMCLYCDAISLWLRFFACQNAMYKSIHASNQLLKDEYEDVECDEPETSMVGPVRSSSISENPALSTTVANENVMIRSALWEMVNGVIVTK